MGMLDGIVRECYMGSFLLGITRLEGQGMLVKYKCDYLMGRLGTVRWEGYGMLDRLVRKC